MMLHPLPDYGDDPEGTLRVSPDGVFVMRTADGVGDNWFASAPVELRRWYRGDDVADWTIVYRPGECHAEYDVP